MTTCNAAGCAVYDLRGITERTNNPCRRYDGWSGEVIAHEGETTSSPPHMDIGPEVTTADYARDRMLAVYTRMPANPAMLAMFGRYLHALADRLGHVARAVQGARNSGHGHLGLPRHILDRDRHPLPRPAASRRTVNVSSRVASKRLHADYITFQ